MIAPTVFHPFGQSVEEKIAPAMARQVAAAPAAPDTSDLFFGGSDSGGSRKRKAATIENFMNLQSPFLKKQAVTQPGTPAHRPVGWYLVG